MQKVRVAVIGAGTFGRNHMRVLHESPDAELVANVGPGAVRDDWPSPSARSGCDPCPCRRQRRASGWRKKEGGDAKVEKGKDVYYKTEGIVSGPPAPKTTDSEKDYPRYNFESRVLLWFANQQHLYYGSFVLAVPIFCMIIEFMGVVSKDKALAKRSTSWLMILLRSV